VCAALVVATGLGLICVALAVSVSTGTNGMSGMAKTSQLPHTVASSASDTTAPQTSTPSTSVTRPLSRMCDRCDAVDSRLLCTGTVGLALTGIPGLLLAFFRIPFLGLLPRPGRSRPGRRLGGPPTPWLALSPATLCVFRI